MIYIQLIGILAYLFWVLSYYRKSVKDILIFQTVANFIYGIHYLLLGALSGAYSSVISIIKNIVFLKYKGNKTVLAVIFAILYIIVAYLFYEGFHSLFPMFANCIFLVFLLKDDKFKLLVGEMICALIWLTYGIFINSYATIITEIIAFISSVIQLRKIKMTK